MNLYNKIGKSHNFTTHLKRQKRKWKLYQKEWLGKKIIKVRAEIKEIEGKKCKDSVKQAVDSLGKKEH